MELKNNLQGGEGKILGGILMASKKTKKLIFAVIFFVLGIYFLIFGQYLVSAVSFGLAFATGLS